MKRTCKHTASGPLAIGNVLGCPPRAGGAAESPAAVSVAACGFGTLCAAALCFVCGSVCVLTDWCSHLEEVLLSLRFRCSPYSGRGDLAIGGEEASRAPVGL